MKTGLIVSSYLVVAFLGALGFFTIDIPVLLPIFGILIVYISKQIPKWRKVLLLIIWTVTLIGFWLIAGWALYFEGLFGAGNHFMWLGLNWLLDYLGAERPTYANFWGFWNLLAMSLFLIVYPFMLWLGVCAGRILFGRSEKQKGLIDLLFPNKKL